VCVAKCETKIITQEGYREREGKNKEKMIGNPGRPDAQAISAVLAALGRSFWKEAGRLDVHKFLNMDQSAFGQVSQKEEEQ
jgi:hypothetical protein